MFPVQTKRILFTMARSAKVRIGKVSSNKIKSTRRALELQLRLMHLRTVIRIFTLATFIAIIDLTLASISHAGIGTQQLLVASARSWTSETGTLQRFSKSSGKWIAEGKAIRVVFGSGLAWGVGLDRHVNSGPQKMEGDKRSPAGIFWLGPAFGYAAEPPGGSLFPYRQTNDNDYFVDDPESASYNRWLRLKNNEDPHKLFRSAEKMKWADGVYELGVVVHHNMSPTLRRRGSAIFLHIWRGPDKPTVGCTAMSKSDLAMMLGWLDPQKQPLLVQAPANELPGLLAQISVTLPQ